MHNRTVLQSLTGARIGVGTAVIVTTLCILNHSAQAAEGSSGAATGAATRAATTTATTSASDEPSKKLDKTNPTNSSLRPSAPRREARRPTGAADDAYRCHPLEDIACTVVRETAEGTIVLNMRPGTNATSPPSWSVVSGRPPGAAAYPGGIIYVVPTTPISTSTSTPDTMSTAPDRTLVTANDAPIID